MFVVVISFPPIKPGKDTEFQQWFASSNQEFSTFKGFIRRRLLKPTEEGTYAAIVEFENRLLILLQWAWNYLTWNRSARLITGETRRPFSRQESSELPSSRRTTSNGLVSTKDNTPLERQELTRGEENEYHCC